MERRISNSRKKRYRIDRYQISTTPPRYTSHKKRTILSVIKIKIGADKQAISNLFSTSRRKIGRTKVQRVSTISIDQISGPDSAQTFPRRSSNELRALRAIFIVTPTNNVPPVYRLSPMINRDRAIRAFDTRSQGPGNGCPTKLSKATSTSFERTKR